MTQVQEQPAAVVHPEMFSADEAATYLRLPSTRAFNDRRREHGVKGIRVGQGWMYSKSQLDALKQMMFGEEQRRARR